MAKKPTLDEMRLALTRGMPSHMREANKAKFLEKSKVKDVLYRGQRRSPKADKFITTQDRATPSFTTDPEVANVYSRQLGWDIEHGPGSTSVPVHVQMEKPFDIRNLGEHASLDEFIDQLDHDLTVPTHSKKLGYEDLADILHTLDNSVFKGGAKHTINARTSKGYKVKGFDQLGDEIISAGKKKDIDRILLDLLPEASVDAYALADNPYFVKNLKKLGYDSIIHKDVFDAGMPYYQGDKDKIEEGYDAKHVIDAYRPLHQNKIKSAIGNRGTYDVNEPDITKAKGGLVMGINVKSDTKAGRSYADLIVDGHKKYESRNADSLRPYVGKRVAIVRTGEGKAKAIGEVTIGEPMVVDKKKFRAMEEHHHVPEGSAFDINTPTKHLYPMHDPVRYDQEKDVGHGIVSRKVIHEAQGGKVKYPSIEEMLQKLQEAGRTPIMPAPDRWFKNPEKHPYQQKAIEKLLEYTGHNREAFPHGAHINPITGEPLDFEIMHDLGVAIDPVTGTPRMSGIKSGLTEIDPRFGTETKSNLIRKSLFKHEGGDPLLDRIKFLATIEKSGKGHHYGLSTQYASPAELVQEMRGNPTLRPHSRGDIYSVGDEVGRISIKGKHHPVYEKLLVAPTGMDVQGKKLHKAKGGEVHMAEGGEIDEYQGGHKPPSESYGAPLHDLTQIYPDDIYSHKALNLYGMGHPEHKKMDMESLFKAQLYRNKPDSSVPIFRAVPQHIDKINPQDWVTLSPIYAKLHGESRLGGKYKILKKTVKAKDLWTAGDSIHEWGYHPEEEKKAKGGITHAHHLDIEERPL